MCDKGIRFYYHQVKRWQFRQCMDVAKRMFEYRELISTFHFVIHINRFIELPLRAYHQWHFLSPFILFCIPWRHSRTSYTHVQLVNGGDYIFEHKSNRGIRDWCPWIYYKDTWFAFIWRTSFEREGGFIIIVYDKWLANYYSNTRLIN